MSDSPSPPGNLDPHGSRAAAAVEFLRKVLPQVHRAFSRREFTVEAKSDESPVTEIDRDVERRLRELILSRFPDDGLLGEELGEADEDDSAARRIADRDGTTGYRWILDPIDGTRPFVAGVPLFGSLVAVEHRSGEGSAQPVVGVCATGVGEACRIHEASQQFGDWIGGVYRLNGKRAAERLATTSPSSLKEATVCYTQLDLFDDAFTRRVLDLLVRRCRLVRGWGDCYGHMMVATARADAMIDTKMSLWDAAALQPIARAAGAAFFDLDGTDRHDGGSVITCAPALRDELIDLLMQARAETL